MDLSNYVQAAGRAVLDMMQREWEPLSHGELEQRLDQAVEDILEADLIANFRTQPTILLQLVQPQAQTETQFQSVESTNSASNPPEEETQDQESIDNVDNNAVKVITTNLHRNSIVITCYAKQYVCHSSATVVI